MKKILYSVMVLTIAAMTFTACEDVPEPYEIPGNGGKGGSTTGKLPYTSANLNTGWTLQEVTKGAQPWSKGSSYAQATGYQKWEGASEKSNKAVEGWLVSPAISTVGYENVKISFNHTIRYTNNVTGWEANHKIYASTNFDGTNASTATWKELTFKPVASPYSDWTLYSSGEIQLPTELVGQETVYIGFWFKAPANASTTWELQTFKMMEGIAQKGEEPTKPDTPTSELGTADAPLTVAKALEIINGYEAAGESATDAYVKGKIVSVQSYNEKYKSITYYISDDGTATNQLQVYSGKGKDGADFTSKDDLKAGAIVVVKGKLKKYVKDDKITPEINQSSSIISIEGNEGGGGDTPSPGGEAKGDGSLSNPFNAVAATNAAKALEEGKTSEADYYIKGKISTIKYQFDAEHGTATFFISEDGTTTNEFQVYSVYYLENKPWKKGFSEIKTGDEVIVYGKITNFNGTPETASKKAYIYSLNGNTVCEAESGGETEGDVSGNTTTVDFTTQGFEDAQEITSISLSDGTKLTFDAGGNNNGPKYYNSGSAIRMYPKNNVTITTGKKILSIELNCSSNNAQGQISASAGSVTTEDMKVKISGINATATTITNAHTGSGATSQLRIKSMTITYAE